MEAGLILGLCLAILRVVSRVVPRQERDAWLQEWEAELRERWQRLDRRHELNRRQQMNLLRRILGSVHDAAWLRRQFTRDAEMVQDIRHGFRLLRRNPAFALLAILVLALGIGATVAIFSVTDVLLVRALPYSHPDRIVTIWQANATNRAARDAAAPANFLDWRAHVTHFDHFAAAEPWAMNYTGGAEPEALLALNVSEGFFEVFGVQPMYGRTFRPEEFTAGRSRAVVLSYGVWQHRFGGDAGLVGRTLSFNNQPFTIVGIMPPSFKPRLLAANQERGVFAPKVFEGWEQRVRGSAFWNVVGRLKATVTIEQAQAELDAISRRLAAEYPRTNTDVVAQAITLRQHLTGGLSAALAMLLAAVGLLLLIAAANVANLLLARGAERSRELAVRAAVGAARARLVRQLLTESLLLAMLGCAAGLGVAYWIIRLVVSLSPADIPRLNEVALDGRILAFAALLTAAVAVVVGILPALHSSGNRLLDVIRGSSAGAGGGGARQRVRSTLVVAEVALALLLMTGAALLLRSFTVLLKTDPGFRPERIIALQIFMGRTYVGEKSSQFVQQILDRMREVHDVEDVGAASAMPFIEANMNIETPLLVEGRPAPRADEQRGAYMTVTAGNYFQTMRIPLREGRFFTEMDRKESPAVAIVSTALARKFWPGTSPLGSRVNYSFAGQKGTAEIVGVVGDLRHDGLDQPSRTEIFVPHAQVPFGTMVLVARTTGDPGALTNNLKAQVYAVDPAQPVYRAATAQELVSKSLTERRFTLSLLVAFASLAAILAAIGIYGVISLTTTQRTREIGVRIALGASRGEILAMVVRQGLVLTIIGVALGMAGSIATARVLEGFLFGISATDPLTLGGTALAIVVVAVTACVVPARRATRVDPLVALRVE